MTNTMHIHLAAPSECKKERIREISDICDNEYYMSALDPKYQNRNRANRGFGRIRMCIQELEEIALQVKCEACIGEINKVLQLQQQALDEIKRLWDLKESPKRRPSKTTAQSKEANVNTRLETIRLFDYQLSF